MGVGSPCPPVRNDIVTPRHWLLDNSFVVKAHTAKTHVANDLSFAEYRDFSGVPFSIFFWAIDVWGLRPFLILACWLNCLGAGIRILSTLNQLKGYSNAPFLTAIIGQIVGSFKK